MKTFKLLPLLILPAAAGDKLQFRDGSQFEGTVTSFSAQNGIAVHSPRSPDQLLFNASSFKEMKFSAPDADSNSPSERVVLHNGDVIPGKLVGLDREHLLLSGYLGDSFAIPRKDIRTLQLGIEPQRLLYAGPAPLADWDGAPEGWTMTEKGLRLQTQGQMERDVGIGLQFILKFTLSWQTAPAIRIYFCDDGTNSRNSDRYYIDVNRSGLQLKRETSVAQNRWHTLVNNLDIHSEAFDDRNLQVEIRGNRLTGEFELYLDGRLVRTVTDENEPTEGSGLLISRTSRGAHSTWISDLEVHSWDAASQSQMLEDPGSEAGDTLVEISGKRMSGNLIALAEDEDDQTPLFIFESPYANEPVKVPVRATSLIFFQSSADKKTETGTFIIETVNEGLLSAEDLMLEEKILKATHPILGNIVLDRQVLATIQSQPES